MRCPKCGHENKDDAVACLMCYAMLKAPEGELKAKPEAKLKAKAEPKPKAKPAPPPPPPPPFPEPSIIAGEKPKVRPERPSVKEDKGYIDTWWEVISSPADFFSRMDTTGELNKAYVFALISMLILGAGIFLGLSGGWIRKWNAPLMPTTFSLLDLILFLLFWAIVFSAVIFIQAGILNICAKLLLGKGSYNGTFKVIAYAGSVNVFGWMPVINVLAGLYSLYLTVIGLKRVHGFSTGKAVLTILLPGLLVLAIAAMAVTMALVGLRK